MFLLRITIIIRTYYPYITILNQERKFRGLYNDVAGVTEEPKNIKLFAMRPDLYIGGKYSYRSSFFSITILKMYLAMIITLVGIFSYFEFCIN
jgi:hypothetical protein